MWRPTFIKQTRLNLVVLAASLVLVSGFGSHSTGFAGYSSGAESTILECGRNGSDAMSEEAYWFLEGGTDVFSSSIMARAAGSSASVDVTTLYLDRYGADIPEGNWWGTSETASSAEAASVEGPRGPDITTLNLDRDGADIVAD